jgi:NADH-quinone oxidoreductase subunit M
VTPFELSLRDAVVLVPLSLAILAFAVYPQRALDAGEPAVQSAVQSVVGQGTQAAAR